MLQTVYFNSRISRYPGIARLALVLILFAAIAQFASFGLIQAHVISFYGAQPEDISFAFQVTYAGIITTLPLQFRLLRYFNTRSYLLVALLTGILLNTGCLFVHDLLVFSVLRFFTGVITCIIAGCMLIVIFSTLPEAKKTLVGTSLFFSLILTSGTLLGLLSSRVVVRTDWTALYYALIGLQLMAMLLCLLIFRPVAIMKPYPLYQLDWTGVALFMFASSATAFVMIYGPKRYWMQDPLILYTSIAAAVLLVLFLFRQASLKRPLIDLRVFRHGKFIFGLLLLLLFYGVRDSLNLLYGYAAGILGWSAADVANAGLYNVAGVIIATFIAVKLILLRKQLLPLLLLTGFALMCCYHIWVYERLTPDLSLHELRIPILLQGVGCGLLFVPVTVFCLVQLPPGTGMTGIVVCSYARFIAVLNSIAGFYTLQLHYNQQFKLSFLAKLIPENALLLQRTELYKSALAARGAAPDAAAGISGMLVAKATAVQSQLLGIRAIFLLAAGLMVLAFIALLLFAVINKRLQK
ncbi:MFS transporter [uncultured Chitinophaga sp.]|jgi:hypothetical protein|uniref:MFS transporter n=1 Tax=uncultured Chitinophaga sp. TaxID=339340 RepID=UPI002633E5A8|nr:MFS transporter [uncultured Chitinophaga sp.]